MPRRSYLLRYIVRAYARPCKAMLAAFLTIYGFTGAAFANDSLSIPDASVITYMVTSDNKVYLRNLNAIDASWQGCCQYYYFDLNTEYGKAQFATFLSANINHRSLDLYISSKGAGGAFLEVGRF